MAGPAIVEPPPLTAEELLRLPEDAPEFVATRDGQRFLTAADGTADLGSAPRLDDPVEELPVRLPRRLLRHIDGAGNPASFDAGPRNTGGDTRVARSPTLEMGDREVFVNFARIDSPDDVKAVIGQMANAFKASIDEARRGVQSQAETARRVAASMRRRRERRP